MEVKKPEIPPHPPHILEFKRNDLEARALMIRWGRWMIDNWHLYRLVITWNKRYVWFKWRKII